jgi:hypothetical protein
MELGQRHHCYEGVDAINTIAGCLPINNGNNTIVMKETIAIAITAKTLCIASNNAIATRATMPAQQQATRATMLAQQQQRHSCALTTATLPS